MIRCLACGHEHDGGTFTCPHCGASPPLVDGFPAFAPTLAAEVEGFDPAAHAQLAQCERGHFWFEARNKLIVGAIARHFPSAGHYLEVGCGTGCVLQAVAGAFPALRISGSEVLTAGLAFAAQRVPRARLLQMDARRLPYTQAFDVIGAYDVIEHIAEDATVLAEFRRALRPGGGVVITVPQHGWLWSTQDTLARHVRRYEPGELEAKLRDNGFEVLYASGFMLPLVPLMLLSRRRALPANEVSDRELAPPAVVNRLLSAALATERAILATGLRLAIGGSRIVVARKRAED